MFTVSYTDVVCLGHIHSTPPGYPILIILIAYVENHFYSWYSTAFRVEIWIVFILSGQYAGTTFVCGTLRTAWRFPLFTTGLPGLELRLSGLTASPHPPSQSHSTSSDPYAIYHSVGLFLFFFFFLSFSSVVVIRSQGPFPKAVEAWAVFSSNSFPHLQVFVSDLSWLTGERGPYSLCVKPSFPLWAGGSLCHRAEACGPCLLCHHPCLVQVLESCTIAVTSVFVFLWRVITEIMCIDNHLGLGSHSTRPSCFVCRTFNDYSALFPAPGRVCTLWGSIGQPPGSSQLYGESGRPRTAGMAPGTSWSDYKQRWSVLWEV